MHILVTGGAGYIGSHTVVKLIEAGHDVEIVDNLSNSSQEVISRIREITNVSVPLHVFDLEDKRRLRTVFKASQFDAVIHFAGLKAVGESSKEPLRYYRTNLDSTLSLLEVMKEHSVHKLVFSSSATVYGSAPVPYSETYPTGQGITNPYGQTKYIIEQILRDVAKANPASEFIVLRYFNPIGAHTSGRIGEAPQGTPNNLMPYITQVATGRREKVLIFGANYDTVDGTGVRDYIHVEDLARGHLAALEHSKPGWKAYNLGSGKGTSVLELIEAFKKTTGISIPYEFVPRRPGDLPESYANAEKAYNKLDWKTEKSIQEACADSWRWQSQNPQGYEI